MQIGILYVYKIGGELNRPFELFINNLFWGMLNP